MEDMGYKMEESMAIQPSSKEKDKVHYPGLHLSRKIPADLKEKKVGEMCRLEVVAKLVGISSDQHGEGCDLEIHELGYLGEAGKKNKDEYLKMSKEERGEYDKKEVGADKSEGEET